tara:strand:+ start:54 stop:449 length:396 start_codon:yes stop_codon:yes gene_type:complete
MKNNTYKKIKRQSLKIAHINQLTQKLMLIKTPSQENIPTINEVTQLTQEFNRVITKTNIFTNPSSLIPLITTTNTLTKKALFKKNQFKQPILILIKKLITKTHFKLFIIQYKFRKEIQEFILRSYQLLDPN